MKNIKKILLKDSFDSFGNETRFVNLDGVSSEDILKSIIADEKEAMVEMKEKETLKKERDFLSKILKGEETIVEKTSFGFHFIQNFQLFFFDAEERTTKKLNNKIQLESPLFDESFLIDNFPAFFEKKEEEEEVSIHCEKCWKIFFMCEC